MPHGMTDTSGEEDGHKHLSTRTTEGKIAETRNIGKAARLTTRKEVSTRGQHMEKKDTREEEEEEEEGEEEGEGEGEEKEEVEEASLEGAGEGQARRYGRLIRADR